MDGTFTTLNIIRIHKTESIEIICLQRRQQLSLIKLCICGCILFVYLSNNALHILSIYQSFGNSMICILSEPCSNSFIPCYAYIFEVICRNIFCCVIVACKNSITCTYRQCQRILSNCILKGTIRLICNRVFVLFSIKSISSSTTHIKPDNILRISNINLFTITTTINSSRAFFQAFHCNGVTICISFDCYRISESIPAMVMPTRSIIASQRDCLAYFNGIRSTHTILHNSISILFAAVLLNLILRVHTESLVDQFLLRDDLCFGNRRGSIVIIS